MKKAEVIVKNKTGLHARPAATFAATAGKFQSEIKIKNLTKDSAEISAKSPVRIMTLGISQGTQIRITANGEDEEAAVSALTAMIESGFGEL